MLPLIMERRYLMQNRHYTTCGPFFQPKKGRNWLADNALANTDNARR